MLSLYERSLSISDMLYKSFEDIMLITLITEIKISLVRGHGGRVVTLSPPTSEAGVQFPAWPQLGKLVVACCWSAVYITEP